jgi:hydroxypyruvate isomerase
VPQFAANLSMMYPELPFLERFAAAAEDGFTAVEYLFPYEYEPEAIAGLLKRHRLRNVLFNLPPGNWEAGERGLAALPGRELEFRHALETAIAYARCLSTPQLHLMAGLVPHFHDPAQEAIHRASMHHTYCANLRHAAKRLGEEGLRGLIEVINPRDMPRYYLGRLDQAARVLNEVGAPQLALQFDLYHCQIVHGDLVKHLETHLGRIAHVQIASVPQRNEPGTGEIDDGFLFKLLDRLGYAGWVGCEYRPGDPTPGGTRRGLGWYAPWRAGPR